MLLGPRGQQVQLFRATKTITFTGGAGNGAVGAVELFNVTGAVLVQIPLVYCSADLTGAAATVKLGTAAAPGLISTNFGTTATNVHAGDVWGGGTTIPLADGVNVNFMGNAGPFALQDDDIVFTIESAPVTGGVVTVELQWAALLGGGTVAAA